MWNKYGFPKILNESTASVKYGLFCDNSFIMRALMWKAPIRRPQRACQIVLQSKNYLVRPPGEMMNNLLTFLRHFIYTHNLWTVTKSCFLEPSREKLCLPQRGELHGLVERPGPLPAGASVNTNLSSLMSWMPAFFFSYGAWTHGCCT